MSMLTDTSPQSVVTVPESSLLPNCCHAGDPRKPHFNSKDDANAKAAANRRLKMQFYLVSLLRHLPCSHYNVCLSLAAFLQRSHPLCGPQGCWGVCGAAAALLQGQPDRRHEPDRGQSHLCLTALTVLLTARDPCEAQLV